MTAPETTVIYDGKIPEEQDFRYVLDELDDLSRDICIDQGEGAFELTIANVTLILDFDEGTIGVLAPAEGEG